MSMHLKFDSPIHADSALNESIDAILRSTPLLSLATANPDGSPHINTLYYAYDSSLRLYSITDPSSQHCRNLRKNSTVAVTVFDSHQGFWTPLRGLQLFGTCGETPLLDVPRALGFFGARFPVFGEFIKHPTEILTKGLAVRFHTIVVERLKLFDEPAFGEEVFIDLNVRT